MHKNKMGLFGRAVAKVFGKELEHRDAERQAEKKVQHLIKIGPRNRDISKDKFIHREIGRIPVFTVKCRKIALLKG
jgi:hypothetical protein